MEFNKIINAISEQSINKCIEYSENKEELKKLISKLKISYKFISLDKYFPEDKEERYVIKVYIHNHSIMIDFKFGMSIYDTEILNKTNFEDMRETVKNIRLKKDIYENILYSILCCCKMDYYTPDNFKEFCAELGYNEDSIKDKAMFEKCIEQSKKLHLIFNDENIEYLPS
jgi:hypothetical protein